VVVSQPSPQELGNRIPRAALDAGSAAAVAETMQALAAPSRLLMLARLRRGPCTVTALAADVGMAQSAVSHQLRLLRHLGLVTATRQGKTTVYALYDEHVAMLLDQAVYHSEHLRLRGGDAPGRDLTAAR
jgi:ArsR family transcriptional regulator, nickel/cobalt-responsive transcriptional repressor